MALCELPQSLARFPRSLHAFECPRVCQRTPRSLHACELPGELPPSAPRSFASALLPPEFERRALREV